MPELPEVETFCQFLNSKIKGKTINNIQLFWPNLIKKPHQFEIFHQNLVQQKFHSVKRRGKYLLFFLDDYVLIVHLRMEGKFIFCKNNQKMKIKNCSLKFCLSNQSSLYYVDSRRFGTFHLEEKKNYLANPGLSKIGLELFDSKLNFQYLKDKWQNRRILIKPALLEQTVIAGIGNIYACEILFLSKISPFKRVNQLTLKELNLIIYNYQEIMKKAIELKGTTIYTFSVDSQRGMYFKELKVYGRDKQPCFTCNHSIIRTKINGRGTFYCPKCQKNN